MKQQISWNGWRKACKRIASRAGCNYVVFVGDEDIAEAFFHFPNDTSRFGGAWSGEYGNVEVIHNEAAAPKFEKGGLYYNQLLEFGKWIKL